MGWIQPNRREPVVNEDSHNENKNRMRSATGGHQDPLLNRKDSHHVNKDVLIRTSPMPSLSSKAGNKHPYDHQQQFDV